MPLPSLCQSPKKADKFSVLKEFQNILLADYWDKQGDVTGTDHIGGFFCRLSARVFKDNIS
jgi:hypothetical protein